MSDLREKVARAIIKAFEEGSPELASDMKMDAPAWSDEADAAIKAVLGALKEPSEAMMKNGADAVDAVDLAMALRDASVNPAALPDLDSGDTAKSAWTAMLTAFTRDHYLSLLAQDDGGLI